MPYFDGMAVDRLSVTVPSELGAALRALAEERKTTVSEVVAEAIQHQIRMAALDRVLADADRRFGPVPEEKIARAMAEMTKTMKRGRKKRARSRRAA